jgi:hypothetical protein
MRNIRITGSNFSATNGSSISKFDFSYMDISPKLLISNASIIVIEALIQIMMPFNPDILFAIGTIDNEEKIFPRHLNKSNKIASYQICSLQEIVNQDIFFFMSDTTIAGNGRIIVSYIER